MKIQATLLLGVLLLSSCTIGGGESSQKPTDTQVQLQTEQQPTSIPNSLTNE